MSLKSDKRWRTAMDQIGKGSTPRSIDRKKFNQNWDRVFNNEQDKEEVVENAPHYSENFGQEKL